MDVVALRGLTDTIVAHILGIAVQAAPGSTGRVEPTCTEYAANQAFVQPVLWTIGDDARRLP
ncbi:hypothetical protein AC628_32955 [Bradyrhizobium sp. NAS96.2]|nr:hypothetical protein AC628_32955 [Bradyrhizobium sp. NAS96.2]